MVTRRVCKRCGRKLTERTGFLYSTATRSYYCSYPDWKRCDRTTKAAALDETRTLPLVRPPGLVERGHTGADGVPLPRSLLGGESTPKTPFLSRIGAFNEG